MSERKIEPLTEEDLSDLRGMISVIMLKAILDDYPIEDGLPPEITRRLHTIIASLSSNLIALRHPEQVINEGGYDPDQSALSVENARKMLEVIANLTPFDGVCSLLPSTDSSKVPHYELLIGFAPMSEGHKRSVVELIPVSNEQADQLLGERNWDAISKFDGTDNLTDDPIEVSNEVSRARERFERGKQNE